MTISEIINRIWLAKIVAASFVAVLMPNIVLSLIAGDTTLSISYALFTYLWVRVLAGIFIVDLLLRLLDLHFFWAFLVVSWLAVYLPMVMFYLSIKLDMAAFIFPLFTAAYAVFGIVAAWPILSDAIWRRSR